jgi:putative transposase
MNATFSLLLAFLVQFFLPRHNAQLKLLKAQIAVLRSAG